jgi:hypothetical protein
VCPIVQTTLGRTVAVVLTALTTAALIGCASGSTPSDGTPQEGSGGLVNQVLARTSDLASALDVIPDVTNVYVSFTDWAMLGHRQPKDQNAAPFAGGLPAFDDQMQRDLGIRSTSADWEIDIYRPGHPGTLVLGFDRHTDLAGLAGKLTRFGYHANGSIFSGPLNQKRLWTYALRNVGIAADRQLLIAGPTATAVRSALAGSANPLGHADSVAPLMALAAARLGRIATASITIGEPACVSLAAMLGVHATPEQVATLRKRFTGTFTRPQAEIAALANPAATTGLDAMTFPDQGAARANKATRSKWGRWLNSQLPDGTQVTRATVTGRVLSFKLIAGRPHDIAQTVLTSTLGVDLCP